MYYPHSYTNYREAEGVRNTNGSWLAGSESTIGTGSCRYESGNGNKTESVKVDGISVQPDGIIYLANQSADIKRGDRITVTVNGTVTINQKVIAKENGINNVRVWV